MLFTNAISPAFHITQGIHPDTGVGFSPIYGREMRAADKDHWVQNAREVPFIHEQCKRAIEEHYDEIAQPESMLSDDFLLRKSDRIRHVIETARAWASKRAREKPRERPILSLGKADEVGIAEALLWYLSLPDQVDSSVLFPLAANPHDASRAVQRTPIGQRPSAPASMATATAVAQQHPPVEKRSRIGVFEHKATARAEVPATLKPQ
jgi:hypothetical protein